MKKNTTIRRTFHRIAVRSIVCVAAAVCAGSAVPLWRIRLIPSLSPFNALLATAAGAGALFMAGAAVIALVCAFWPRLFCRWVCPVGTCQDAAAYFIKRRTWISRMPQIGLWLVFIGTGAALAGYPLFGWFDPLVLFNAFFGVTRTALETRDWLAAAGFPALLILALAAPGLWCGKLCPLGALQDLVRFPLRQRIPGPQGGKEAAALGRRAFIGLGLGAGYRFLLPPARAEEADVIRPPASGAASRFTRLCVRCGACVRACPSGIIRFGDGATGWHGVLAPELYFDDDYCNPGCNACGKACPSGAIQPFKPEQKFKRPLGTAAVDVSHCLLSDNRECGTCTNACPHGALDLAWDPENMTSRVVVDAAVCTGCGCCEYVCPATPKAIRVKPVKGIKP